MTQLPHEEHGIKDWIRDALAYADELLEYVVELRAETETKLAVEEGQRVAWGRMVEDGIVPPTVRKMWVAKDDDDVDEACIELDGTSVPLDALFSTEVGEVEGPPLHPHCRCGLVLVNEED